VTYDPRRLQGVSVYRTAERQYSVGDRVQFTAPYKNERIANRQLGTIEKVDASGDLRIRLDSGRDVYFNLRQHPHLDYGYAVTSHSGQGATADRVLVHVDSENTLQNLINSRLAYVAVSRGRYDAQIYTNDANKLGSSLSREVSKEAALNETGDHGHRRSVRSSFQEVDSAKAPEHLRTRELTHSWGFKMSR
jgi:ATP-dependent exoDNAse (exonuclease V) alpha subunit